MAKTIIDSFNTFLSNLEITDRQISIISSRRENIVGTIKKKLFLHQEISKLIGSYDRNTLIRYLSENDIDIMIVLDYANNKDYYNSEGTTKILDRLKSILDETYPNVEKRRDRNCIRMKFAEFDFDIVPAFVGSNGDYFIPDSIRKVWIKTNPIKFQEKITNVNKNMGGKFIPMIKIIKAWNRNNSYILNSFHIENILYNRYKNYSQGYSYDSMCYYFFQDLPGYLSSICYEPIFNERIDYYLDNQSLLVSKRQRAIKIAENTKKLVMEAFNDQSNYLSISIDEWKNIFGDFFPSYG